MEVGQEMWVGVTWLFRRQEDGVFDCQRYEMTDEVLLILLVVCVMSF